MAVSASLQRGSVARLMASFRNGDQAAAGQLVELFYPELRRIAAARMRAERPDHTLQPTAVVHQLYLELVKIKALRPSGTEGAPDEKSAFLGLAAYLIKQLLIHHARPLSKRTEKAELRRPARSLASGSSRPCNIHAVADRFVFCFACHYARGASVVRESCGYVARYPRQRAIGAIAPKIAR